MPSVIVHSTFLASTCLSHHEESLFEINSSNPFVVVMASRGYECMLKIML
jgi:hypothetical protein